LLFCLHCSVVKVLACWRKLGLTLVSHSLTLHLLLRKRWRILSAFFAVSSLCFDNFCTKSGLSPGWSFMTCPER